MPDKKGQVRNDVYWATLPKEEIGDAMLDKIELYKNYLNYSGLMQKWIDNYNMYYNSAGRGAHVYQSGSQNEYRNLNINHFRSFLINLKNLILQSKGAYDCKAINTDVKSQAQCIVGNQVLEYYSTEKQLDDHYETSLESALVFGEGWMSSGWEVMAGKQYGVNEETGAPIMDGDLKYDSLMPIQVTRDFTKMTVRKQEWYITTTFENRWNFIAKYPELTERIRNLSIPTNILGYMNLLRPLTLDSTDDIPVYTLYHDDSPAVPGGRMTTILDNDLILFDGKLPYDCETLHRMSTMNFLGTSFGYTVAYDLMACQEALHGLDGSIITNQLTFAVQNVLSPRGSATSAAQLSGGLNLIEYDPEKGKPEALNLTSTPPEVFNYRETIINDMGLVSGINSTVRGDPSSSLKSGSALALVESQAIQFSQGLQQSFISTKASVGTSTIKILQVFATTPREIAIAGKSNRFLVQQFKGGDITGIARVQVDIGNPLAKTLAGRQQMATDYMQQSWIQTPAQYEMVMATGRLEPLLEGTQMELILIRQENEDLVAGKPIVAIMTDDHITHIMEHKSVLASPDARTNAVLVKATLDHIQQHINELKGSDPALMAMLRQPLLGGQQPAPGNAAPTQGQPGAPGQVLSPVAPVQQQAMEANMPKLPDNPMTGQPNATV